MFLKPLKIGVIAVVCILAYSCKENRNHSKVTPVEIKFKPEGKLSILKASTDSIIQTLTIEIADDDYQTQTGLMYRKGMEANQGMLFIFPDSEYRYFYMKNTLIPLDIIYIDQNKAIVSIQKNAKPFDETSLPSEAPAQYVLEINGGLSTEWNLETGDKIQFSKN
ncbi:DUF192 domain-containing protein [Flavobacteriaceae bacterium LMO-SS05]